MALRVPFPDDAIPGALPTRRPPYRQASLGAEQVPQMVNRGVQAMAAGMQEEAQGKAQMTQGIRAMGEGYKDLGRGQMALAQGYHQAAEGQVAYGKQLERNAAIGAAASDRLGQTIENLGSMFFQVAMQEKAKADNAEVLGAIRDTNEYINAYVREGALQKKGKDAIGITYPTMDGLDQFLKAREANLANDAQRMAFRAHTDPMRQHTQELLIGHQTRENEKFQFGTFQSSIQSIIDEGTKGYQIGVGPDGDPAERMNHYLFNLDQGERRLREFYTTQGRQNEIPEALANLRGTYWSMAIKAAVLGDPTTPGNSALGQTLFDKYGNTMNASHRMEAMRALHPGIERDTIALYGGIASKFTGKDNVSPDYETAEDWINQNVKDPELAQKAYHYAKSMMDTRVKRIKDDLVNKQEVIIEQVAMQRRQGIPVRLPEEHPAWQALESAGEVGAPERAHIRRFINDQAHIQATDARLSKAEKGIVDKQRENDVLEWLNEKPSDELVLMRGLRTELPTNWDEKQVNFALKKIKGFQTRAAQEAAAAEKSGGLTEAGIRDMAREAADAAGYHQGDETHRERRRKFIDHVTAWGITYKKTHQQDQVIPAKAWNEMLFNWFEQGSAKEEFWGSKKSRWEVEIEGKTFVPGAEADQETRTRIMRAAGVPYTPMTRAIQVPKWFRDEYVREAAALGVAPTPENVVFAYQEHERRKAYAGKAEFGPRPIDLTKPMLQNKDGSISTEETMTVEVDGKHFVIPTIVDGQRLDKDAALKAWKAGKNPEVGVFKSAWEASRYAIQRSKEIGRLRANKELEENPTENEYGVPQ